MITKEEVQEALEQVKTNLAFDMIIAREVLFTAGLNIDQLDVCSLVEDTNYRTHKMSDIIDQLLEDTDWDRQEASERTHKICMIQHFIQGVNAAIIDINNCLNIDHVLNNLSEIYGIDVSEEELADALD